jgi:diguanylate cyclase (GGDEF)-like protein/PAS domain S-box-containing protein
MVAGVGGHELNDEWIACRKCPVTVRETHSSEREAVNVGPVTTNADVSVLIIDDNPAKRLALKSILVPLGYSRVEADSGLAGLRALMTQNFAVILLDVRMPDMDGFETAALIRARLASEMTPIIFITAYASDEFVVDRYVEGAVDFMFAPVQPDELRAKVTVFGNLFAKAGELAAQARAVKTTADQLRLLTDAAPVGIFQTDAENRYVYTNPQWSAITGVSSQESMGKQWDSIIDVQQRDYLISEIGDGTVDPADFSHRFVMQAPGSLPRTVLLTSKVIPDVSGGTAGWVGTLTDVTAEATAEATMSEARVELEGLNKDLTIMSLHDPLTGLGNRRALDDNLQLLDARVRRYGHRYCLALIDVDFFKAFNDDFGHQAGDKVLQAVAAELDHQARSGDAVYRYGGEEFLCIFPEQEFHLAMVAVQRMRVGVENLAISHNGSPYGVVTMSAGLAMLDPGHDGSPADVLKEADDLLYRAKDLGRNRVEYAALQAA